MLPSKSSHIKAVYDPRAFLLHAALLRQTFVHCAKFPTAASRRSLGRVSVPVRLIILSDQLMIVALVSLYLTNKLIIRRPLPKRIAPLIRLTQMSNPQQQATGNRQQGFSLLLVTSYLLLRLTSVRRTTCGIRLRFRSLSLTSGYVPTRYSAVRHSCILTKARIHQVLGFMC